MQQGILDEVRVRVPRSVVGPFETSDDLAVRLHRTDRAETSVLSVSASSRRVGAMAVRDP